MENLTYDRDCPAHLLGVPDAWFPGCNTLVKIPDQAFESQREWDGIPFPAILPTGEKITVKIDGAAYGLWTSGTGDCCVIPV